MTLGLQKDLFTLNMHLAALLTEIDRIRSNRGSIQMLNLFLMFYV